MRRTTITLLTLTIALGAVALPGHGHAARAAQPQPEPEPEPEPETGADATEAITAVLERFARARQAGDMEGARACTHPEVVRRIATARFWGEPCAPWVRDLTPSSLRFIAWQSNDGRESDALQRIRVQVYGVGTTTASARLSTIGGEELVHLVRFDGAWVIADTLRSELPPALQQPVPATGMTPDRLAIEAVCQAYAAGFYTGDGARVQGTCHTSLTKRSVQHPEPRPGQPDAAGFDMLETITYEELDRLATFFQKTFGFDPETARRDVEVYDADGHTACAKLTGASWFDYLHLVKLEGEWEIVHIVFEPLPREDWDTGG